MGHGSVPCRPSFFFWSCPETHKIIERKRLVQVHLENISWFLHYALCKTLQDTHVQMQFWNVCSPWQQPRSAPLRIGRRTSGVPTVQISLQSFEGIRKILIWLSSLLGLRWLFMSILAGYKIGWQKGWLQSQQPKNSAGKGWHYLLLQPFYLFIQLPNFIIKNIYKSRL